MRLDGLQLLKALVDGDFADLADPVHILLGDVQIAHLGHEVNDARSDGVRRVFRNQVVVLNAHGHEYAQLCEFQIHVERAAISLNESIRLRLFKVCFF